MEKEPEKGIIKIPLSSLLKEGVDPSNFGHFWTSLRRLYKLATVLTAMVALQYVKYPLYLSDRSQRSTDPPLRPMIIYLHLFFREANQIRHLVQSITHHLCTAFGCAAETMLAEQVLPFSICLRV